MILALGIIGLVCCQIAAPIAWGLGHADLAAIRAGQMDPVGTSITKAGMVLGIAGTLILLLAGALPFLTIAFN